MLVVERPPSSPQHLRYSFVITSTNITVQLAWQPPTSGDITGYRVTCTKAGPDWYTDRRTLVTTTLPSVRTTDHLLVYKVEWTWLATLINKPFGSNVMFVRKTYRHPINVSRTLVLYVRLLSSQLRLSSVCGVHSTHIRFNFPAVFLHRVLT